MEAAQTNDSDLIGAIRELISRLDRPLTNELWDAEDIATYVRLSKKSVQNHMLDMPGFPRPVVLPTGGRRWVASEIKAWVLRHR
jgi:predicted DNA-binding transcriptional regulator AlpA